MRSVVVVLPASMWAMIPMLRVFSRLYLRGMEEGSLCVLACGGCRRFCVSAVSWTGAKKRALSGPDPAHGDTRRTGLCLEDLHGNGSVPAGEHAGRALAPR